MRAYVFTGNAFGALLCSPRLERGGGMFSTALGARAKLAVWLALLLSLSGTLAARAADGGAAFAARTSPDWLRDAVVYEVFPRAFSAQGNFQGVIPQLDRLKALGVTVIWLMPVHPVGKEKA